VEHLLAAGLHVAGVHVGVSCGSPRGVEASHRSYELLVKDYGLNVKARLLAQSNGGLIHYNWAIAHPECVDRVLGLCPVTDLRSWPGLDQVVGPDGLPAPDMAYDLSVGELGIRIDEFNPIARISSLAAHGVRILHLHGDRDELVPLESNSVEFVRRYRALGGEAELEIIHGMGHEAGPQLYESKRALQFLVAGDGLF
jgi:pimeloyl-ACP methyl ester carboxylesterase